MPNSLLSRSSPTPSSSDQPAVRIRFLITGKVPLKHSGATMELHVPHSDVDSTTILDMKHSLRKMCTISDLNMESCEMKIIFMGRVLQDTQTVLSALGTRHRDTDRVQLRPFYTLHLVLSEMIASGRPQRRDHYMQLKDEIGDLSARRSASRELVDSDRGPLAADPMGGDDDDTGGFRCCCIM